MSELHIPASKAMLHVIEQWQLLLIETRRVKDALGYVSPVLSMSRKSGLGWLRIIDQPPDSITNTRSEFAMFRRLTAARHALSELSRALRSEFCDQQMTWCRAEPQRSKAGSKRRVQESDADGSCYRSPSKRRKNLGFQVEEAGVPGGTSWESLSYDIQENILQRLDFKEIFRFKTVSLSCKKLTESEDFRLARRGISEGDFTAINYYVRNSVWQCRGYDLESKSWRALPSFSYLPLPSQYTKPFGECSMCGHRGLMCTDVSKLPKKGELVVFNPLTGKLKSLPPLLHPRNPVLVHIAVDPAQKSYKVVVAGSSTSSEKRLSRKLEIFDSVTSKWKRATDIPGPEFGLNEPQSGVCLNGVLFFVAFMDDGDPRRGVVALDLKSGKWLKEISCPIPFHSYAHILQLVECDGKLYLFSEQEQGRTVEHFIDQLEVPDPNAKSDAGGAAVACRWRNVVRVKRTSQRGFACVGFGKGKLCIFNTQSCDGVVYDIGNGQQTMVLEPPPVDHLGEGFVSFNPASFTIQPRFDSDPKFHIGTKCSKYVYR